MFEKECLKWLGEKFDALTDHVVSVTPSSWAEENRYLPASVTPLPGYYNYEVAPALREIADCMDIRSSVREVTLQKGAQIGATVGVLENTIGYVMAHVKSAPMMMMTADAELAKLRMESYITPMIQQSGLSELIRSSDENNNRKTGKTNSKIEWLGGGFLIPLGAKNAAKLRSISIQYLLQDEPDGYPDNVGRDGDPGKLAEARTKAYHQTRKVLRLSTPLIKGQSRIERHFKEGDQRYYEVPCKACGKHQKLRFTGVHEDTGDLWGLIWNYMDDGVTLKPDSVRYVCKFCGHKHINSDKTWMFNRGKWVPTAKPKSPGVRSYHLNGLYSPASMFTWEAAVLDYLSAWDTKASRPKDLGLLQEFYNNILGETFEIRGDRLRFAIVSAHRRQEYAYGNIPNSFAVKHAKKHIMLLTCAVDVHKDNLKVAVFGWTVENRSFLIDYFTFEGDTEQLDDPGTWGELSKLVEAKEYIADDGRIYKLEITLVDSGYRPEQVYSFCGMYDRGVYPIKGRELPPKNATFREFSPFTTKLGTTAYGITVDIYKDRWAAALRRNWDGEGEQPRGHFNAPVDATDKQLKELTVEQKREKIEKKTGKRLGFEWHRPNGAKNELWDLLVYNNAALELIAWDVCLNQLEEESVNWTAFWELCENNSLFYT